MAYDDDSAHLSTVTINDTRIVTDSDMKQGEIDADPNAPVEPSLLVTAVSAATLGKVIRYDSASTTTNSSSATTQPLVAKSSSSSSSIATAMRTVLPLLSLLFQFTIG